MKSMNRLPPEKLFGLTLAALVIVTGLWMIYLFGPRPGKTLIGQELGNQPASVASPKIESRQPVSNSDLFNALFKASTTTVASGRSGDSVTKYCDSLEAIYRRRGYKRFETAADGKSSLTKLGKLTGKNFWRTQSQGISAIGAIGEDANPSTDVKDGQKQVYLTTVSPADGGGGSQWTTYRYFADTSGLQTLRNQLQSDGDWSGQDPPEVPRAPGLRRLISFNQAANSGPSAMAVYQSGAPPESLAAWYTKEMPKVGWTLNPHATAQAGEAARGTLYFTKGNRSCLVWISSGSGSDQTSVIINSRSL